MKDAREVLRQKEADLTRVRKEVDSLRLAAPLLDEESDRMEKAPPQSATDDITSGLHSGSDATGTDGLPSGQSRSIWNAITRRT